MSGIRARLALAIQEHPYVWSERYCRCESGSEGAAFHDLDSWAEHVAAVLLSLPDIAIVELPKPCATPSEWRSGCLGAWAALTCEPPVSAWTTNRYDPDGVAMPGGDFISIKDARALAAALLAAANAADAKAVNA